MAGEITTNNNLDLGSQTGTGKGNFFQEIIGDPQKRLYAIIGAAVIVVLLIFTITSSQQSNENRGKLVPIVQQLDQSRAFEIVAKLKSVNIEAKVNSTEKPGEYQVQVYDKAVESAYLALSRTNLLENDGYGLFDESDWAASDYDKRIKLTRAINGDLSRIISRIDGLRAATVRVNVPEQQIFTEMQSSTTATVQVELLNDADELTASQVKGIVNILRGYVPNLDKEKISIVDTQGRNYSTFKEIDEQSAEDFIDEVEKINKIITKRISEYLDAVIGSKEYKVSVSAMISREKVEQQKTIYSEGAVGSRQLGTEALNSGSGDAGYGPGQSSNSKNYNSNSINETLLPSFEQQNITYLPGRIDKVTVALAIDKSIPTMISLKQLQDSIAAMIGPTATADDIKLTVVDLHSKDGNLDALAGKNSGPIQIISNFFRGGVWSVISKIFSILAIIFGLLIVAIISLNFLSAVANKNYQEQVDPNLGDEFDQVLNDDQAKVTSYEDYGESKALEQQEALLKEMMSDNTNTATKVDKNKEATVYESNNNDKEQMQFDSLLNNFQSVAADQPDILAKKIQMWLDED